MIRVEQWHRRHALQIAAQLPENHDDAMAVLCAAMNLVKDFLDPVEPGRVGEGSAVRRGPTLVSINGAATNDDRPA